MPQIFIHTPSYKGSDYIAHLLEHIMLGERKNPDKYFAGKDISGENYTYYTSYVFQKTNPQEVIKHITSPLNTSLIEYEKIALKSEYSQKRYFQNLISKIGKKLYGKEYSYSQNKNFSKKEIISYHQNYYRRENMILLPDELKTQNITRQVFTLLQVFDISLQGEKEKVFVANYSHENIFVMEIIGQLFDQFIHFSQRYQKGEYYYNETLSGEFEDFVFLSIDTSLIKLIQNIPDEFVQSFIIYTEINWDKQDFSSIDGPLMLKYGFSLSDESKREILQHIGEYVKILQSHF